MRILFLTVLMHFFVSTMALADRARSKVVAASAGIEVKVSTHASWRNCKQRPVPKIKLILAPKNGTVTIRNAPEKITNRRHACYPKTFKGIGVFYTPNTGYLGWEKIVYRRIRRGGVSDRWTIAVEVHK